MNNYFIKSFTLLAALKNRFRNYFKSKTTFIEVVLVVIGVQKGGTTSLYKYLSAHPQITAPEKKEINYFNSLGTSKSAIKKYQQRFAINNKNHSLIRTIDVSPAYLLDAPIVAKNIAAIDPEMKIVVILREPVERAVSAWFMYKKYWQENPNWFIETDWVKNSSNHTLKIIRRHKNFGLSIYNDLKEEIEVLNSGHRIEFPIVEYGLYTKQLTPFFNIFGRNNILILDSDSLNNSTQKCLDQITDFIKLSRYTLMKTELTKHFTGSNNQSIDVNNLDFLKDYYKVHNIGLEQLINRNFTQ